MIAFLKLLMLLPLIIMIEHIRTKLGMTLGLLRGHTETKACVDEVPPLTWLQAGEEACGAYLCKHLIGAELHTPVFVASLQQQGVKHLSLALDLSLHGPSQHVEPQSVGPGRLDLSRVYGSRGVDGKCGREALALKESSSSLQVRAHDGSQVCVRHAAGQPTMEQ